MEWEKEIMKKRSKHKARVANIPMMDRTRRGLALELHMAIVTLIEAPSPDAYNTLAKMLASMCRAGVTGHGIDASTHALTLICERFERIGKVGVSDAEADILRSAAGELDVELARVPVNKIMESVATVSYHCAEMGA